MSSTANDRARFLAWLAEQDGEVIAPAATEWLVGNTSLRAKAARTELHRMCALNLIVRHDVGQVDVPVRQRRTVYRLPREAS